MRISNLAEQTGLSVDTIRFYERKKLIDPEHVTRLENGYRDYNSAVLDRLYLVKRAKCLGFSLTEISRAIGEWENDALELPTKRRLFEAKLELIDVRIAELEQMKTYLREKLASLGA